MLKQREMRRNDRVVSEEEAKNILTKAAYGVLATIGEDQYPYGIPLSYAYADGKIYFHCAKDMGHKLENIKYSDKVCFTVVGETKVLPEKFSTIFESTVVFGKVCEVEGEEKIKALMYIVEKYSIDYITEGRKYVEQSGHQASVYKIITEKISGKSRKM